MNGFLDGFLTACSLWKIGSSRTLKRMTLQALPLYISTCVIGCIFTAIDWYVLSAWKDRLLLNALWIIGWGLPAYSLGSLLQIVFLDEVVTLSSRGRELNRNLNRNIAEALFGAILGVTFLAQTYLFSWMIYHLSPSFLSRYLSMGVNIVMISWATSFAAIECQLNIRAKNLKQRIEFCERNWIYALGFGLPAGLIYNLAPPVFATGLWQFTQLLCTFRQTSVSPKDIDKYRVQPLRIFQFAELLADQVIYLLDILIRSFF